MIKRIILFVLFYTWSSLSLAETNILRLTEPKAKFRENYSGKVKVSGSILVGLAWLGKKEKFNPSQLRLAVSKPASTRAICIGITTRDGKYWALNQYSISSEITKNPRIEFGSIPSDIARNTILKKYDGVDVAIRATKAKDCNEGTDGPVRPILLGNDIGNILAVWLNIQGRVPNVELISEKVGQEIKATCSNFTTGIKVAFSKVCEFKNLDNVPNGRYRLKVSKYNRQGRFFSQYFDIILHR